VEIEIETNMYAVSKPSTDPENPKDFYLMSSDQTIMLFETIGELRYFLDSHNIDPKTVIIHDLSKETK
jgi:hypothetical protein